MRTLWLSQLGLIMTVVMCASGAKAEVAEIEKAIVNQRLAIESCELQLRFATRTDTLGVVDDAGQEGRATLWFKAPASFRVDIAYGGDNDSQMVQMQTVLNSSEGIMVHPQKELDGVQATVEPAERSPQGFRSSIIDPRLLGLSPMPMGHLGNRGIEDAAYLTNRGEFTIESNPSVDSPGKAIVVGVYKIGDATIKHESEYLRRKSGGILLLRRVIEDKDMRQIVECAYADREKSVIPVRIAVTHVLQDSDSVVLEQLISVNAQSYDAIENSVFELSGLSIPKGTSVAYHGTPKIWNGDALVDDPAFDVSRLSNEVLVEQDRKIGWRVLLIANFVFCLVLAFAILRRRFSSTSKN